ncbi:MAG: transcription termination factor NusA [Candidatus Omnitrophica bacterium]|nr:transcription termination factor NusA [Candidatus Omnitrophota bacterium]
MTQELIGIIEQIEREKGIKKEVLIEAVESALLTAAKKVIDVKPDEEITIKLDPQTGKFHASLNGKEITSMDFGRIAASTARQVIIQRMREAEKDVIFHEFQGRVGEIVSGTVYRFEKGNVIIDLLGKAEGVLLKRDQSPKEEFKQGQRVRAYILEVRKESKGPQIVLSRAHHNFVKKLFELEVPEIYEGIVEIKAIARQPGERTKISVFSKNDKVDPVGACVGMRGNRVRNIVNEIHGERIDIVRYNDDIKEYIKAGLSPAKVAEIKLNKEGQKAEVIVEDDQLSLAIGKHGQNVRLASRLINWDLDIRTKAMVAGAQEAKESLATQESGAEEVTEKSAKKTRKKKTKLSLELLSGIGEKTQESLKEAGFEGIEDILKATVEDLTQVKGIGEKKAEKIIDEAKKHKE